MSTDEQPGDVEGVDVLGWALLAGEGEMGLEERGDVGRPRIVAGDGEPAHARTLRDPP